MCDAGGKDYVLVGCVWNDISYYSGINLWVVVDNVCKGVVINVV